MTDDNVRHLPEPGVVLDLDIEERPAKDVKPAFVAKVGGRNITMSDPSDIDWRDLASVEIPQDLLRVAMAPEERDFLVQQALPAWKFNRLMEAYYTHYDLEGQIKDAKRRAQFSG